MNNIIILPNGHLEKVKSAVIIYAVIILVGITALAAGHFLGIALFIYSGLFIIMAGVLMEIIFVIIQRKQ